MLAAGKLLLLLGIGGGALALGASRKKDAPAPGVPGGGVPGGGLPGVPGGGVPGQTIPGGYTPPGGAPGGAPGGMPGGFPGFPGGIPGFPGGIPGFPGGAAPGGAPGGGAPAPAPPGSMPTTPLPEGNGVLVQSQNGVVQVRPDAQPAALQALNFMSQRQISAAVPGAPGALVVGLSFGTGARQWAEGEAAKGRNVLASDNVATSGAPTMLASVLPGQEVQACQRGSGWVLLLTPAAGQGGGGQQPTTPNGTPYDPANIPGDYPGGGTIPAGWPTIPGGMPPGFPGGALPGGVPGEAPAPPAPAAGGYTHVIRKEGNKLDLGSSLALWYTGNAGRWPELQITNPELRLVYQNGQKAGFDPWRPGQILKLPPGWDGSKGPGPVAYGVGGGGGSGV